MLRGVPCRGPAVIVALGGLCAAIGSLRPLLAQPGPPGATLVGFAALPADTFAAGPPSGRFRNNGAKGAAFESQPVQGVSSIRPDPAAPGWWWCLSDNGYGIRLNSPDYLLRIYRLRPDWQSATGGGGGVEVGAFIQLADPDGHAPFRLVREDTPERWLTGGDFDPESFVRAADGSFWIGDEFGPFLLHADGTGRLLAPPFAVAGLRSPDTPGTSPPDAGRTSDAVVRRSRGFEGLAISPDGSRLFAMLEGPTLNDGPTDARILEFDPASGSMTGREWIYPLSAEGHSATELVAYGADRFLVIERDGGHGPGARFKRVFAIELGAAGSRLAKTEVLDLLRIRNPGRLGGQPDPFTFPFITTEAVWPEDSSTLVLVNDNNYPETGGRVAGEHDGTEFIRVRVRPLPTS